MGETKNQLRINSDINDAKFEMCWINIKWSVVQKRVLKLNICVDPNWNNCPNYRGYVKNEKSSNFFETFQKVAKPAKMKGKIKRVMGEPI